MGAVYRLVKVLSNVLPTLGIDVDKKFACYCGRCVVDDLIFDHTVMTSMLVSYVDVWSSGRNILKIIILVRENGVKALSPLFLFNNFHRNPEPEFRTFIHFALYADVAMAGGDDGLTDGEAEACALHKLVELDETIENCFLLVVGDACSGVFAEGIDAHLTVALLQAIAYPDAALLRVFQCVAHKIAEYLAHATDVDRYSELLQGFGGDEAQMVALHAYLDGLADVFKLFGKVNFGGLDVHRVVVDGGGFEDAIDETHQDVAMGADDVDEAFTLTG